MIQYRISPGTHRRTDAPCYKNTFLTNASKNRAGKWIELNRLILLWFLRSSETCTINKATHKKWELNKDKLFNTSARFFFCVDCQKGMLRGQERKLWCKKSIHNIIKMTKHIFNDTTKFKKRHIWKKQGRKHGYPSRVRMCRGHIWGQWSIWAGAV